MNSWIILFVINALLIVQTIFGLAVDEDVQKGMEFRRGEFNNMADDDFQRNVRIIDLINEHRHLGTDWSVAGRCRVNSPELSEKHCIDPSGNSATNNNGSSLIEEIKNFNNSFDTTHPMCFSAKINYNYTDRSGLFGQFPEQLEFLRHFPRCWLRLAPLICLGHFRPCTIADKNNAATRYVLLQQFPAAACLNMLEHCEFAAPHFLRKNNKFPDYLDCGAHFFGSRGMHRENGIQAVTKKTALYVEDCKVNYMTQRWELAAMAGDAFQCLWPLVKKSSLINSSANLAANDGLEKEENFGAMPLIDACYMPCQTPMFSSNSLRRYNSIGAAWYILVVIFVFLLLTTSIFAMHGTGRQKKRHQHLPLALSSTIICAFISLGLAAILFALSILPFGRHRLLGELATCLGDENQNDGRIRRFPNGFQLPEGKENALCALQAFLLDFLSLFANSSFCLLCTKLILLPNLPPHCKYLPNFLPKWHSPILTIAPMLFALLIALHDLFFSEVSVDPVNGMCHFFLNGNFLLTPQILWYPLIILIVAILIYYMNWVLAWKRKQMMRKNRFYNSAGWNGNNNFTARNRNFGEFPAAMTTAIFHQEQRGQENMTANSTIDDGQVEMVVRNDGKEEKNPTNSPGTQNEHSAIGIVGISLGGRHDELDPLRGDADGDEQQQNVELGSESVPIENAASNVKTHSQRRSPTFWLANLPPRLLHSIGRRIGSLLIGWIFLMLIRFLCAQMLMGPDEESQFILKSISCTINRTLSEGIPLDWIDRQQYANGNLETNPHIRREQLQGNTAARYCELEQLGLQWYWAVSFLFGLNFLLIAVVLASIAQHSADILSAEREFEAKEGIKLEMEMQEMRARRSKWRGGPRWSGHSGRYPLRMDDDELTNERSSNSDDYARIHYEAETSVTSTMIPPSTIPPSESRTHPPPAAAAAAIPPPPELPPSNSHPPSTNAHPIPTTSSHSSAAASSANESDIVDYDNYILAAYYAQIQNNPEFLQNYLCQQHEQQQQQFGIGGVFRCNSLPTLESSYALLYRQLQGCCQPIPQSTAAAAKELKEAQFQTRGGICSEPGAPSTRSKRSRRHILDIRKPPKELKRVWEKEESQGRKRRATGSLSNSSSKTGVDLTEALDNMSLSELYGQKHRPNPSSFPIQLPSTSQAPPPPNIGPQCSYHHNQLVAPIPIVLIYGMPLPISEAGNFVLMNGQPPPQQQRNFAFNGQADENGQHEKNEEMEDEDEEAEEEERPSTTSPDEQSSSFRESGSSEEEEEELAKNKGKKIQENGKNEDGAAVGTTSLEPSSSSIPSSEVEEDDRDSNDFDSNEEDEEEKRRWEEHTKQLLGTATTSTNS